MHFEFLTEDQSSARAMEILVPKLLGTEHTFRMHPYKGIGRIPKAVLSTERNLDLLIRAKAAGFHIESVFVLTANPELNVFRVKSRELSGGHSVPPDKIRSRYIKSLANISKLLALSDVFRLVDNTAQPEILFFKDGAGQQMRTNQYWTVETIETLIAATISP